MSKLRIAEQETLESVKDISDDIYDIILNGYCGERTQTSLGNVNYDKINGGIQPTNRPYIYNTKDIGYSPFSGFVAKVGDCVYAFRKEFPTGIGWKFNILTEEVEIINHIPADFTGAKPIVVGDYIYIFSHYSVYRFDSTNDSFTKLPSSLPYDFFSGVVFTFDDNIVHLVGGGDNTSTRGDHTIYNLKTNTYTHTRRQLDIDISGANSIVVGSSAYIFQDNRLIKYDNITNSFSEMANVRYNCNGCLLYINPINNNQIIIVGGGNTQWITRYDISSNRYDRNDKPESGHPTFGTDIQNGWNSFIHGNKLYLWAYGSANQQTLWCRNADLSITDIDARNFGDEPFQLKDYNAPSCIVGNTMYTFGGAYNYKAFSWNMDTNEITKLKDIDKSVARAMELSLQSIISPVGNKIYLKGNKKSIVYDIDKNEYTQLNDLPNNMILAGQHVRGTDIFIVGGSDSPNTITKHDTITDTYSLVSIIPSARGYAYAGMATGNDNEIYFTLSDVFYIYDIDTAKWTYKIPHSNLDSIPVNITQDDTDTIFFMDGWVYFLDISTPYNFRINVDTFEYQKYLTPIYSELSANNSLNRYKLHYKDGYLYKANGTIMNKYKVKSHFSTIPYSVSNANLNLIYCLKGTRIITTSDVYQATFETGYALCEKIDGMLVICNYTGLYKISDPTNGYTILT